MSLLSSGPLIENWTQQFDDIDQIVRKIQNDSEELISNVLAEKKDEIKNQDKIISPTFESDCRDRINGILVGLCKRIMKTYSVPKKVLSEIIVTNVAKHHEGRLDAIFEFDDGYGVVDWKTATMNPASSSGYDRWQLIANLLLANYRYSGNEDDWSRCKFGSVVYYTNSYIPKFPLQQEWISKVQSDRLWAYQTLSGSAPYKPKPDFCQICDTGASGSEDCRFYRNDTQQSRYGNLNSGYLKIRSKLFQRRYVVLAERAVTHKYKYLTDILIRNKGENNAIEELERLGIVQTGFTIDGSEGKDLILKRDGIVHYFSRRKPLRIIGIENEIPLLACVNAGGSVKEILENKLVVQLYKETSVQRALHQLSGLPLIVMLDEINLTRRLLEPLHRFHRFAADALNRWDENNGT